MSRRTNAATTSETITVTVTEPLPLEDLEETTVDDYRRLNDKLDNVMSKIKGRKESKGKRKK